MAPARLRWVSEGLAIAASGLVTALAFLTPAGAAGVSLRVVASALTVGLVVRAVLRFRRARAARRSSPRTSEEQYQTFIDRLPVVGYIELWEEDGDARVIMSPRVEDLLGWPPSNWSSTTKWASMVHPDDRERMLALEAECRKTGQPFQGEYRVFRKDGSVAWVRDEAALIHDADGRPAYWQGVMFDITERKLAEEGLERALTRERDALRALREVDAMKNTFLHAVSHELRTPLASILGFAVTLEHHQGTLPQEETQELTKRLAVNARKLDRLLSDLLDLDRLDRGIIEPKWRPTDVGALVRHAVQESDLMVERPLRIEADPVLVSVDGAKVERIVENLLANTARHTDADTPIWIWVRAHDGGVLIVVEDAGRGVPAELRETIFRPFEQGPERSAHSPGVGIGLSLVGRFASLHGGRAWVEDRPGGGASFRVWLPDGPPASAGGPGSPSHPRTAEAGAKPQEPPARAASA